PECAPNAELTQLCAKKTWDLSGARYSRARGTGAATQAWGIRDLCRGARSLIPSAGPSKEIAVLSSLSRSGFLCLAASLGAAAHPGPTVQRLYVDPGAAPGGNGVSWAMAYRTLDEALNEAILKFTIQEVWVREGVYTPVTRDTPSNPRSATFRIRDG